MHSHLKVWGSWTPAVTAPAETGQRPDTCLERFSNTAEHMVLTVLHERPLAVLQDIYQLGISAENTGQSHRDVEPRDDIGGRGNDQEAKTVPKRVSEHKCRDRLHGTPKNVQECVRVQLHHT